MFSRIFATQFLRYQVFKGLCCLCLVGLTATASDAASVTRISGAGIVDSILLDNEGAVETGDSLQFSLLLDEDMLGVDFNSQTTGSRHQIPDANFTLNVGDDQFDANALIDVFLSVTSQLISISDIALSGDFDRLRFDSFSLLISNITSLFSNDSLAGGLQALTGAEAPDVSGSLTVNSGGAFSSAQQIFSGGVSINVERNVSTVPIPATVFLLVGALGMLWRISRRQQT